MTCLQGAIDEADDAANMESENPLEEDDSECTIQVHTYTYTARGPACCTFPLAS